MATATTTLSPKIRYQPFTGLGTLPQRDTPIPQGMVFIEAKGGINALGAGDESYLVASASLNAGFAYQLVHTSLAVFMNSNETMTWRDTAMLSVTPIYDLVDTSQTLYVPMFANDLDLLLGTAKQNAKVWAPSWYPPGLIWGDRKTVMSLDWSNWDLTPTSVAGSARLLAMLYFYPWSQRFSSEANQSVLSLPYGSSRTA